MDSSRLRPNTLLRTEKVQTSNVFVRQALAHSIGAARHVWAGCARYLRLARSGRPPSPARGPFHLALDLLHGCGMIQQSEEGFLAVFEARDLENSRAAPLVTHSAKNTGYVLPGSALKPSSRW